MDFEHSYVVAGREEITVPAGKYETIKIECVQKLGGDSTKAVFHYAKDVGLVRMEQSLPEAGFHMVNELKSFTPGKAKQ